MKSNHAIIHPMLATDLEAMKRNETYYLDNPLWGVSQKVDGRRIMALTDTDDVVFLNRRGEKVDTVPKTVRDGIMSLGGGFLLDGELLDGTLHVFDCIGAPGAAVLPGAPYIDRYQHVNAILDLNGSEHVVALPFIVGGATAKRNAVAHMRMNQCEGYMLRNIQSPYQFAVRSRHLIKVKFWRSLDAIVYHPGRKGKLSVGVALVGADGKPVDVGAVAVTEATMDTLTVGDVIEVKYLYSTDAGRLYQPSFLRKRDDKGPKECTVDQMLPTSRRVVNIK